MLLEPRTIGAGRNGPSVTPRHIVATQKTLIWSIPSPHVPCRPDGQARGAARRSVRMGPELLRLGSERGRGRAAGDLREAPRRPRALRRALELPHVRVRRDRADRPGSATPGSAAALASARGVAARPRGRALGLAAAVVVVVAVVVISLRRERDGVRLEIDLATVRWQAPTDFLLNLPGDELLRSVPQLGLRGLDRRTL